MATPVEPVCSLFSKLIGSLLARRDPRTKISWRLDRPAWWQKYARASNGKLRMPAPDDRPHPRLVAGTLVRLRGKPDRERRVIKSEWHSFRYEFVYVVETSARPSLEPYWFADQLEVVEEDANHERGLE